MMNKRNPLRNLLFILLGVFILVFKRYYAGPWLELFNNYASNISVSFAIYFIALIGFNSLPRTKWLALIGTLLAVELFELTNGFGIMENVYDPWDYLANALGIGLAWALDTTLTRTKAGGKKADE